MVAVEDAPPIRVTSPAPARRVRATVGEALPIIALVGAFFVVNDIRSWLTAQYWGDEAWVALSVRFPLADLPVTTSSSPIGWSFLLRLVPDIDHLRVVPLGFQLLTVVAAYLLGRSLASERARGILIGVVTGLAVLLLPVQQTRHDLKQYTADAAVAVCLLALATWTERSWSRRRLAVVVAAVGLGMLLSHTTAIVAVCVLGGLLLSVAVRREWARTAEATVAGLITGALVAAVYFGVSARGNNDAMRDYWDAFLPSISELPAHLVRQAKALSPMLGAPVPILAVLLVLGVLTLFRRGHAAPAIAVLLLPVAAIGLGVAGIYPLLDPRTSHFLIVVAGLVAGIGIIGLADLTVAVVRRGLPRLPPGVVAAVTCAVLLASFAAVNHRWYRTDGDEPGVWRAHQAITDIGSSTRYVAAHKGPHDLVVVSGPAWFGFTLYSDQDPLKLVAPVTGTVGWTLTMPTRADVILPKPAAADEQSIKDALDEILAQAAKRPPGTRVWLVRAYTHPSEPVWQAALADYHVQRVTSGPEPVVVISKR
ncbi:DUF6541 family protein [Micromonospora hortensis]|uniref:DUF6541 family protein n=1 Tax=Micromonospora hortensis TaxID=2911209 RepID=UPI001EE7C307|nr:DUF6541 family protein [Micromonospora hortensis]MCG5448749.1 hypothetical protein [Micromonospora hortensis]